MFAALLLVGASVTFAGGFFGIKSERFGEQATLAAMVCLGVAFVVAVTSVIAFPFVPCTEWIRIPASICAATMSWVAGVYVGERVGTNA